MKISTLITTASVTLALLAPSAAGAAVALDTVLPRAIPAKPAVSHNKRHLAVLCRNSLLQRPVTCYDKSGHRLPIAKRGSSLSAARTTVTPYYVLPRRLTTETRLCTSWASSCELVPPTDSTRNDKYQDIAPGAETAVADSSANSSQNTDSLPELPAASSSSLDGPQDDDSDC